MRLVEKSEQLKQRAIQASWCIYIYIYIYIYMCVCVYVYIYEQIFGTAEFYNYIK